MKILYRKPAAIESIVFMHMLYTFLMCHNIIHFLSLSLYLSFSSLLMISQMERWMVVYCVCIEHKHKNNRRRMLDKKEYTNKKNHAYIRCRKFNKLWNWRKRRRANKSEHNVHRERSHQKNIKSKKNMYVYYAYCMYLYICIHEKCINENRHSWMDRAVCI